MSTEPTKTLADVIREVGRYPADAFDFVRIGLSAVVERVHGPASAAQRTLHAFMASKGLDVDDLCELAVAGKLEARIERAITKLGGFERLNRHVSGQDLCWALRDLACQHWGRLAPLVLARWRIRATIDFGHIVYAMIDNKLMSKQPHDSLNDFADVYDFAEAFAQYAPGVAKPKARERPE